MNKHVLIGDFPLGQLMITPGALEVIHDEDRVLALARHIHGDWGDVCEADDEANDWALENGGRLLSVYKSKEGVKFWVITEADRSVTTILLPDEY